MSAHTRRDACRIGAASLAAIAAGAAAGASRSLDRRHSPAGISALGWYVQFAHPSQLDAMERHFAHVLNLPRYRRWRVAPGELQSKDFFWLGETVMFDLSYQGKIVSDAVRQVPIMRVGDVGATAAAIRARGGEVGRPVDGPWGRETFVTDPSGQQLGLRAAPPRSGLAADREANRRAARGEAFNPGCAPLPAEWRELGWVQIRAADPARLARFYQTMLGLPLIARRGGSTLFDLGDAVTLEIVGGGTTRPAPPEQYASTTSTIFRARGLAAIAAQLQAAGVTRVGKAYSNVMGDWFYIADPEGNVVGLCEWHHPSSYAAKIPPQAYDLEAQRRAIEAAGRNPIRRSHPQTQGTT